MNRKRKYKDIEKELEKVNIFWEDPWGYVLPLPNGELYDDEYVIKQCTIEEVEKQVDIIIDNRLRRFGINP